MKKKDDPFRAEQVCDDLLTDEFVLDDARWKIGKNLTALQDENIPADLLTRCYLMPEAFKLSTKTKLDQSVEDGEAQKACRLALNEIEQVNGLLTEGGTLDRKAVVIYFHSLRLFLNLFRAGTLAETVQKEEARQQHYIDGAGAKSKREGKDSLDIALMLLEKCGGIKGYDALPRGEKKHIRETIEKGCLLDERQVYNILKILKRADR